MQSWFLISYFPADVALPLIQKGQGLLLHAREVSSFAFHTVIILILIERNKKETFSKRFWMIPGHRHVLQHVCLFYLEMDFW